jgi:arginase family enzyme
VRFDGMGRSPGQAGAPQALRAAGLETALPTAELTSDVILPAPTSARGPAGFISEPAAGDGRHRLLPRRAQSAYRPFPLLYGADCAVLLAAIPALRDTTSRAGLLFVDAHEDATPMERCDTDAAEHLARHAHEWWLHIDLDVLAGSEFPACDAATDPATPGRLTWTELVTVTTAALRAGGCRGCSIGVYNTDLDPRGHTATRIVAFVADVFAHAGLG